MLNFVTLVTKAFCTSFHIFIHTVLVYELTLMNDIKPLECNFKSYFNKHAPLRFSTSITQSSGNFSPKTIFNIQKIKWYVNIITYNIYNYIYYIYIYITYYITYITYAYILHIYTYTYIYIHIYYIYIHIHIITYIIL
jgi:hypothetical protein